MTELKKLFERRDAAFKSITVDILDSLPNVLDACRRFVTDHGHHNGTLSWEDISYLQEEEVVLLVGIVQYNPGDIIEMPDGEKVKINEATAEYFKSMLRLGIPYKLATHGTTDDVYEWLTQHVEHRDGPEEIQQKTVDETDFNLDDLTEEQRQQLEMFAHLSGGKVE